MKVAFHFDSNHPEFGEKVYSDACDEYFFSAVLSANLNLATKVFVGDLLLRQSARDDESTGASRFSPEKYDEISLRWLSPGSFIWNRFTPVKIAQALDTDMYVICVEGIDEQSAERLCGKLEDYQPYLGALEVDDSSGVHWVLYSDYLTPLFRVNDERLSIFWDGVDEESKAHYLIQPMQRIGFAQVQFESLNGRYTIFDKYHDYDHASRVAEWKRRCGSLFAFIVDDVVNRLSDIAPEVGNRLWVILTTYENAETNEQMAHVALSCRRLIEYVVDQMFPPSDEMYNGHELGADKFRNRLWAFVDIQRSRNRDIDLIVASNKMLDEQIAKLLELANKGVHSEIYRQEARRCMLRTILLLDDIISLKANPFEIRIG